MNSIVDLPRARRAMAALDRIAAEHPELCQGVGHWNQEEVMKIMGTPAKDRALAYRQRLAAQGITREVFFATPEAKAALAELRYRFPAKTRDSILCEALILLNNTVKERRHD